MAIKWSAGLKTWCNIHLKDKFFLICAIPFITKSFTACFAFSLNFPGVVADQKGMLEWHFMQGLRDQIPRSIMEKYAYLLRLIMKMRLILPD